MTDDTDTIDNEDEVTMTTDPGALCGDDFPTASVADEDLEPQVMLTLTRTWKKDGEGGAVLELVAFLENGEDILIEQEIDPEVGWERLNDLMDDELHTDWARALYKLRRTPKP